MYHCVGLVAFGSWRYVGSKIAFGGYGGQGGTSDQASVKGCTHSATEIFRQHWMGLIG